MSCGSNQGRILRFRFDGMEVEVSFTVLLSWRGLISDHVSFDPILHDAVAPRGDVMGSAAQIDIHQRDQSHPVRIITLIKQ